MASKGNGEYKKNSLEGIASEEKRTRHFLETSGYARRLAQSKPSCMGNDIKKWRSLQPRPSWNSRLDFTSSNSAEVCPHDHRGEVLQHGVQRRG